MEDVADEAESRGRSTRRTACAGPCSTWPGRRPRHAGRRHRLAAGRARRLLVGLAAAPGARPGAGLGARAASAFARALALGRAIDRHPALAPSTRAGADGARRAVSVSSPSDTPPACASFAAAAPFEPGP